MLHSRSRERYEIVAEHGRGGLGRVSRAHDRELDRDVAIKELIARNHISELRFLREALITARLEHPGIVPVHEAGRWPDGTPFYAMKLVAGRPLRELIAERSTVEERIGLLHHVIAVADAIAYAHGRNIIHRDLKPANVIVGDFGETIVIDWGLAKDLTTTDDSDIGGGPFRGDRNDGLTSTGSVLGTPAYMAPEQERGEHVDQRADVFAIGAMLWELCSLQKVPPADRRQRHRMLRRAGIDKDLVTIVDKALDPDPGHRYPDAGALAADLKAFKSGARIAARSYSLFAMLAHWTRRHRALALSVAVALALVATGSGFYVRRIAVERDRADTARADAESERAAAATERDRAQLSEAAMWLERDPTHARDLLRSMASGGSQRALLLAQAENRSAARVLQLDSRVQDMQVAGVPLEAGIVTVNGDFVRLDLDTGTLRIVDHHLTGPLISREGGWCYSLVPPNGEATVVSGCGPIAPLGALLRRPSAHLAWVNHVMYALEAGDLYRLDSAQPTRVEQRVRDFGGSDKVSMICTRDGRLRITRDGKHIADTTCVSNGSASPFAARDYHYVALQSPHTLISDRGAISIPVAVQAEYELVLGDNGLIALSDFSGEAWIARPGSLYAEPVSKRGAHPRGVSVDGTLVAFGYSDGAVVVVDTANSHRWEFIGHERAAVHVAVDAIRKRVISNADNEIRIWELRPPEISLAVALPCNPFHIVPIHVSRSFVTDCGDGRALIWTPEDNLIRTLHAHRDLAYGVVTFHDDVCTGGWDGRILCTPLGGGETKELLLAPERVKAFVPCLDSLFVAIADGSIWRVGRDAHILYKHHAMPYRLDVNYNCTRLASGAYDGSLIVYDLVTSKVVLQAPAAHRGQITNVSFKEGEIVTSGVDAKIRFWNIEHQLELSVDTQMSGPVKKLRVFSDGWAASVSDNILVIRTTKHTVETRLLLTHPIADIAISSDERYVAIANLNEIIVIDRDRDAIAVAYSPASDVTCLQFIGTEVLAACDRSSILMSSIKLLRFLPMNSAEKERS